MIVFEQCRIDDNCLIIEASVDNADYYDNVYIDSIVIDNRNTYVPTGPSSSPIYQKTFNSDYIKVYTDNCDCVFTDNNERVYVNEKELTKHIRITIPASELGDINDIFFVYAVAAGTPSPDTPCGRDNIYTMCVAYNSRPIYDKSMSYIKELNNSCDIPKGFIDMILNIKAFELSLKTGHITEAIRQWDRLSYTKKSTTYKGCGCYGVD